MEENSKRHKKIKIELSRDEVYWSTWDHWDRMQFLVPQLKLGSTADTIALQDKEFEKNVQSREINDDNEEEVAPKAKRKSFAEKRKKERSNYSKVLIMRLQYRNHYKVKSCWQ